MELNICIVVMAICIIAVAYYVLTMQQDLDIIDKKYDKVCEFLDLVGDVHDGEGKKVKTKDFIDDIIGEEKR